MKKKKQEGTKMLSVLEGLAVGEQAVRDGKVVTQAEAKKRFSKWTKEPGVAHVLEKDGKLFLRLPRRLIAYMGLRPGDEARWRQEKGTPPLSPEKLTELTQKMVDAKTKTTAAKLKEEIVEGFYGVPCGWLISFFRRGRPVIPKSSLFPKFAVPPDGKLFLPASIKTLISDEGVAHHQAKKNPHET